MISWPCKCAGTDVITDAAAPLLARILALDDLETKQKKELWSAQRTIVQAIQKQCWPGSESAVLWVHCYTRPHSELEDRVALMAATRTESAPHLRTRSDHYLHRAAGLTEDIEPIVRKLFDKNADGRAPFWLAKIPPAQQMSNVLNAAAFPICKMTWSGSGVVAEPDVKIHAAYEAIFDGRENGVYVHVGLPCRIAQQHHDHAGIAGAYLFLANRGDYDTVPACLLWGLRSFVQSMVTAQTSALVAALRADAEQKQNKLFEATREFRRSHSILRSFAAAAETLAVLGDSLGVKTTVFDKAQGMAIVLFRQPWHTVRQFLGCPDPAENIRRFIGDLKSTAEKAEKDDESAPLVNAFVANISRLTDLEDQVRWAKALEHHSVPASLLHPATICPKNAAILSIARGIEGDMPPRYQRQAICRLYKLTQDGHNLLIRPTEAIISFQESGSGGAVAFSESKRSEVVSLTSKILSGKWGEGERDLSQGVAVIVRGLALPWSASEEGGEEVLDNSAAAIAEAMLLVEGAISVQLLVKEIP